MATTSDKFELVQKGNEDKSLADNLYDKHKRDVDWWLGSRAK